MYKKCGRCKEEKLFTEFSKNRARKDGYDSQCKCCKKQYQIDNKIQIAEKRKLYWETNKEKKTKYNQEYYDINRDIILAQKKEYCVANKDKLNNYRETHKIQISNRTKLYREINKEKIALQQREYQKANPAKMNAISAKRRAAKLQATPNWLTQEDFNQIEMFYKQAHQLMSETDEEYHVDHIIPLQGENVCGLHVPWNLQVILAKENLTKSNKLLED